MKGSLRKDEDTNPFVCRYQFTILDGGFYVYADTPSGWTHLTLNYIGPDDEQGIDIYHDGTLTGSSTAKHAGSRSPGDTRVVIGRAFRDRDDYYGGVEVDELLFFNEKLTDQQIQDIFEI